MSGGLAQDFDGNDVQFAQQKKPTGYTGGGNATCWGSAASSHSNAKTPRLANTEGMQNPAKAETARQRNAGRT